MAEPHPAALLGDTTESESDAGSDAVPAEVDALARLPDNNEPYNEEHGNEEHDHDNEQEAQHDAKSITAGWHRSVRAEWVDGNGLTHSLPDLSLSIHYSTPAKTAFFKLQTRIDLKSCKAYLVYLHFAPEILRRLTTSRTRTQGGANARCLHVETAEPAALIVPRWPCQPKNPRMAKKMEQFQALGRCLSFRLHTTIPPRAASDAAFQTMSDALARQDLKADTDEADYQGYYRGQGASYVDLTLPTSLVDSISQEEGRVALDEAAPGPSRQEKPPLGDGLPPSYRQVVAESSSPPSKKRRRAESHVAAQGDVERKHGGLSLVLERVERALDVLRADSAGMRVEMQELQRANQEMRHENGQLKEYVAALEKRSDGAEKALDALRAHNEQLRADVRQLRHEDWEMRLDNEELKRYMADLEERLNKAEDHYDLEERVDGVEYEMASLEAWREDHECDHDYIKDTVRQILEEETDELSAAVVALIAQRLGVES
jgi:regulator of replication initiation timing